MERILPTGSGGGRQSALGDSESCALSALERARLKERQSAGLGAVKLAVGIERLPAASFQLSFLPSHGQLLELPQSCAISSLQKRTKERTFEGAHFGSDDDDDDDHQMQQRQQPPASQAAILIVRQQQHLCLSLSLSLAFFAHCECAGGEKLS